MSDEYQIKSDAGGKIIHGDCFTESDSIEAGSVDLVLTDPSYGTVKGVASTDKVKHGMKGQTEWDEAVCPTDLFSIAERLVRKNGKTVLFGQEPYTSKLITNAKTLLPFSYRMVWEKDHFANSLIAKTAPVKLHEDILVFTKEYDTNRERPLRKYFEYLFRNIDFTKAEIIEQIGQEADHCFRFDSTQFGLCTRKTYQKLIDRYSIDELDAFKQYSKLKSMKNEYENIFNLQPGNKYKGSILKYSKPDTNYHPTQKPVPLLADLIRTFTHDGDRVVDLTAGSGSTAVACYKTNRECIAIEKDREFFDTAVERVSQIDDSDMSTTGQYNLAAYADRNVN